MQSQSSPFCSIFETESDREARLFVCRLQSHPIPIWWYRRRVNKTNSSEEDVPINNDLSPFPKSWSINYNSEDANDFRKKLGIDEQVCETDSQIQTTATDESSIFSTASQERRQLGERSRDKEGNCIRHPSIKLAEKRSPKDNWKPRLSKMFGKYQRKSFSGENDLEGIEWTILLQECPECKAESTRERKLQYQSKATSRSAKSSFSTANNRIVTHEPFPATITIAQSHPHLSEGSLALKIRTDPIPIEQSRHLSCTLDNSQPEENLLWKWSTPDGCLDFLVPCNADGNPILDDLDSLDRGESSNYRYQIMERIIPLSCIDHISRGGDAWDVLRQSMGENDLGCRCDLKIHGFSDRLLRFDVISFSNLSQSQSGSNTHKMRYSFALVDFIRSSISCIVKRDDSLGNERRTPDDPTCLGNYTSGNVMSSLNSLVMWDRERREMGVEGWRDCFCVCLEEYLSLGVPSARRDYRPVGKKKKARDFY